MKLSIESIAKIERAQIEMNGITVIAGENNTGKSTVGKVLYSIFSSLHNCEKKIDGYIKSSIDRYLSSIFLEMDINFAYVHDKNKVLINRILEYRKQDNISTGVIYEIIAEEIGGVIDEDTIHDCAKKIESLLLANKENIKTYIVEEYFSREFCEQINNLNKPDEVAHIVLTVKNKNIDIKIQNNKIINLNQDINLLYDATYLDSPMAISDMDRHFHYWSRVDNHRQDLIRKMKFPNKEISIVDESIVSERLDKVISLINKVVSGKIISNKGISTVVIEDVKEPINLENLSSGMKSFLILKTIILNGYVMDKSVVILDEPEIHLHPKWQLILAEVIVLLQKEFEITCLINTHSPYFLNAIEIFSAKEGVADRCNYYLAENCEIKDVTFSVDRIYEVLSEAFDTLDEIQGE